jgi:hypothetical protein
MPFLPSNSLGAGLGKRTRKLLGAHQERISIALKENTAVLIYRRNYKRLSFPALENLTSWDSTSIVSFHHLRHIYHSYHSLINSHYFAQRNKKNLAPIRKLISYLQNEENFLRWRTASTSIKLGQNKDQTTASTWFELSTWTPKIGQR